MPIVAKGDNTRSRGGVKRSGEIILWAEFRLKMPEWRFRAAPADVERRIRATFAGGGGGKSAKNWRIATIPPVMDGIFTANRGKGGEEKALNARLTDCGRGGWDRGRDGI